MLRFCSCSDRTVDSGPECDGHTYDGGGCKEFPGLGRGNFNAAVDAQDSFQTYLPMFQSAVARMCRLHTYIVLNPSEIPSKSRLFV